jgi:hypothetical protein
MSYNAVESGRVAAARILGLVLYEPEPGYKPDKEGPDL